MRIGAEEVLAPDARCPGIADELLHFAAKPVASVRDEAQSAVSDSKPSGFWVSVGTSWADWCLSESYGTDSLRVIHRVVLADDARILRLASSEDLRGFTARYGARHLFGKYSMCYEIDWSRIAAQYDGIIIAPYIPECRHELSWYYGWDVASGCIWKASAVARLDVLDIAQLIGADDTSRLVPGQVTL